MRLASTRAMAAPGSILGTFAAFRPIPRRVSGALVSAGPWAQSLAPLGAIIPQWVAMLSDEPFNRLLLGPV